MANNELFRATDLSALRGNRQLYQQLNVTVNSGESLQISGRNGSGKTTLIRQLCGFIDAETAQFEWQGQRCDIAQLADEITYCGHRSGLDNRLSVMTNLELMYQIYNSENTQQNLQQILEFVRLTEQKHVLVSKLSAGQVKQLSLARLRIANRSLWLVDEPFSALDNNAIDKWCGIFQEHINAGGALILTSHQSVPLLINRQIVLGSLTHNLG